MQEHIVNIDALQVLHQDNHLLAVNKPGGMPSQPDASGDVSLDETVREWLRITCNKKGNVYLALLHRLDRPTSGLVLLARTEKAAGRMADLFRRREIAKTYLAVVECPGRPEKTATLENYLEPAENGSMRTVRHKTPAAREARLVYRTLAVAPAGAAAGDPSVAAAGDSSLTAAGGRALLEIDLLTGVKHQIRCQLAQAGLPVVGDFRYGAFAKPARPEAVFGGRAILLHARRAEFLHPVQKEGVSVSAPLPGYWRGAMRIFGGADILLGNGEALLYNNL